MTTPPDTGFTELQHEKIDGLLQQRLLIGSSLFRTEKTKELKAQRDACDVEAMTQSKRMSSSFSRCLR